MRTPAITMVALRGLASRLHARAARHPGSRPPSARRAVLVALALCAGAAGGTPGGPAAAHASFADCDPPRRGLALKTKRLRVWRDGARLVGCAEGHRRRVLIGPGGTEDLPLLGNMAPLHLMRPERLAGRGTVVAYGAIGDGGEGSGIWSQDLSRPIPEVESDGSVYHDINGVAFEFPSVLVGGLSLGANDEIAAIVCPRAGRSHALERMCLRPGALDSVILIPPGMASPVTTVAAGRAIDPRSLRGHGSHFSWLDGGRRRRAPYRDPPRAREDCARDGRTVARNGRVRLLRRAETGISEADAPLSACLLPRGRIQDISHAFLRPGNPLGGVHVGYQAHRYAFTCFHDSSTSVVAVTGLDPSVARYEWDYENELAPGDLVLSSPSPRRLYVTRQGSAVWSVRGAVHSVCSSGVGAQSVSTWILAIDGRTGGRLTLAHDARVDPRSLRLSGRRASWLRAGVHEYADLP